MKVSVFASVFYVIAFLCLASSVYFFPKKDKKLVGASWIALIIIMLTCYQAFVAAIFDLVHIPINIISIGIADLLASGYFWYQIYKKKKIQKYTYSVTDGIFLILLVGIVACFAHIRYGGWELNLNFLTIDPVSHFRESMDTVMNQTITSMFYEFVCNALFIEVLAPFSQPDYYYRWFVLSCMVNLAMSGLVFYGVIRRKADKPFLQIAALVLSCIYVVGYPMNVTIYGFVYLGMGVTLIAMLVMCCDIYVADELPRWMSILFLMLGCLGIFECYVMFMPVTFFAIITCVFVKQWRKKKLISWETVLTCLAIFLIPCILGFLYTYMGIFQGGVTVSSAIANEGATYRNLYSDFVFFVPVMLVGFWGKIKNKVNDMMLYLAPYTLVYTLYMLYKTIKGTASTYYYYKLNYLIWLIVLLLAFEGFYYAKDMQAKILATSCVLLFVGTGALCVGKVEEKLHDKNNLLVEEIRSDDFNRIVSYNLITTPIQMLTCTPPKMLLCHYVYENILPKTDKVVPIAAYWEDDLWYQAITNQRYYGWGQSDPDHTDYFEHLNAANPDYIVVLRDSQIYIDEQEYFNSLESVFDNDWGYVAVFRPYGE